MVAYTCINGRKMLRSKECLLILQLVDAVLEGVEGGGQDGFG